MLQSDPRLDSESEEEDSSPQQRSIGPRGGSSKVPTLVPAPSHDDLDSTSSASASEDAELLGEVQEDQHLDRHFPIDIFPRVLLKAYVILEVKTTSEKQSVLVATAAKFKVIVS